MRLDTLYVSIGNSDDKLTQVEWHRFWNQTDGLLCSYSRQTYGIWVSLPNSMFQNACWAIGVRPEDVADLKRMLSEVAEEFRQDSIAVFEGLTTFVSPPNKRSGGADGDSR